MKKKLKKALMAAGAAYGASKFMGAGKKSLLAATEDNKDMASTITGGKNLNDYNMSNSIKKKTLMEKAKNFLKTEVFTTNPKTKAFTFKKDSEISGFGLGAKDGAKDGGMMYANKGTMVMAKCKMGRNKATKIT